MNNSLTIHVTLVVLGLLGLQTSAAAQNPDAKALAFFESKLRPVLVKNCYQCHSAEAARQKKLRGGLQLDTREGIRKGGDTGPAIVPRDPKKSLLLSALRHDGEIKKMPPRGKLSNEVIADFVKWIEMGAPDPRDGSVLPSKRRIDTAEGKRFWSFRPIVSATPPDVKNTAWVRNPIDRFILAGLEAKNLVPSKPLPRERLLRRVTFDLTGLPPTPAEVDAFLNDSSPDALERVITRLLAGERYGERWGRHWLDVARFAESGGYEFDGDRRGAYHYRDFIIKALNQDMPFDEFVRLQLAGDEIKPNDFFAVSATGFLVAGPYPGQTTAKTLEPIRYDHLDDMIATTGTAFLGMTLGCARCHEHKFDPIPQQDYYRLIANLARTDSMTRQMDPHPEAYRKTKAAFDSAHAPLAQQLAKFEKETLPGRFAEWLAKEKAKPAAAWLTLEPTSATGRTALKKLKDGSYLATGKAEKTDTYTLTAATSQTKITAVRLEALRDDSLPKAGPGRSPDGNFTLTEFTLTATPSASAGKKGTKPVVVKFKPGKATFERGGNMLASAIDGDPKTGWSVGDATGKDHAATFVAEKPFGFEGGTMLSIVLKFERAFAAGRVRLAITTGEANLDGTARPQSSSEILTLIAAQEGKLDGKNRADVVRWFRKVDPVTEQAFAPVERSLAKEPKPPLMSVFSATSGRGGDVYYLIRGETERKNGVASPGFAQVLANADESRWLRVSSDSKAAAKPPRVALADWMTDSKHGGGHLLARVIVNRLWQHHFGKGIVRTPNDFGAQGEPPTHPELLDYLATELIKGGWRLKPIHKLILTSATYQQGGDANGAALRIDPQNRLWWHIPPRRLEAEAIRDSLLMVGGSLDLTMFGPGTLDENSPRRSIYLTVKRSRLLPILQAFDAPEPIQSVGERQATTATTQALMMMNSRLVRLQAEKLAHTVLPASGADVPQTVEKTYRIVLGRRPGDGERQRMADFILRSAEQGKGPKGLETATADFCQVLLCLNEFLYVD
ncbi:MAG TPA: PSD1 and planctomycete cytochrome C domain-containing protein [Gemmataceae bacterium]|nr:PSD1 and planctomycete cytochrome C domain-containing protein [Gemmataceae bacterium]